MRPIGTVREFAEPLQALRRSPELLIPFGARSGTTVEHRRPALPPGYVQGVRGAGEMFFRDTGARRRGATAGTIVLLHGWMVPSDAHWLATFGFLQRQGWRVIALDARGHGRGLRTASRFTLSDCASDVQALLAHLDPGPVVVVGYSMGGLIAQIIALRAPELLAGVVLCATGCEFQTSMVMRTLWSSMGALQVGWQLAPQRWWSSVARLLGRSDAETADWMVGELARGAAWDIAEAGREIGRFDSRPWLAEIEVPISVLVTRADLLVPPQRQRDLARRLGAPTVEIDADHLAPATSPGRFHRGLGRALAELTEERLAATG